MLNIKNGSDLQLKPKKEKKKKDKAEKINKINKFYFSYQIIKLINTTRLLKIIIVKTLKRAISINDQFKKYFKKNKFKQRYHVGGQNISY